MSLIKKTSYSLITNLGKIKVTEDIFFDVMSTLITHTEVQVEEDIYHVSIYYYKEINLIGAIHIWY